MTAIGQPSSVAPTPDVSPSPAVPAAEEGGRRRGLRVAGSVVTTVLLAGLVVLAILTVVVPKVIGAVPLTVLSGSMEPALSPGDLIVSRPVDTDDIVVGDVITFQPESDDPALITHRVVGHTLGGGEVTGFITRGDANNIDDDPILAEQVMGRVAYSIPLVGHVTNTSWGPRVVAVFAVGLVAYGLVMLVLPDRSRRACDTSTSPDGGTTLDGTNREEADHE